MSRTKLLNENLTPEQKVIAEYIDANASDILVQKINEGNKTMADCWSFIFSSAKSAAKGKSSICLTHEIVFGWAIHYFEEDDIKKAEAIVASEKPKEKPKEVHVVKEPRKPAEPKKPKDDMLPGQMTIMDLFGGVQ